MEACLRLWQLIEEGVWEAAIDVRAQQDPVQVKNYKSDGKPLAAPAEASRAGQNYV